MQMTSDDKAKFKALYVQTARSYITDLQKNIAVLQTTTENGDAIKAIHLAAHSLTSQSALMGYTHISSAASAIEKYSKSRMDSHTPFTPEAANAIADLATAMSQSIDEIDRSGKESDLSEQLSKLKELRI